MPGIRRWLTRTHAARVSAIVALLVVMTAIVALTAVFTYRHVAAPRSSPPTRVPPPSPVTTSSAPNDLAAEFAQLANGLHAKMGVAVSAVGDGSNPWIKWTGGHEAVVYLW
jgi:hypothetical protein